MLEDVAVSSMSERRLMSSAGCPGRAISPAASAKRGENGLD